MEVRLDAPARQMDQQRAHQHLRRPRSCSGSRQARPEDAEQRRKEADRAAEEDRRPHVKVDAADRALPRERRYPEREDDAEQPLEGHQPRKQPIGSPVDVVLVLSEELARAKRDGLFGLYGRFCGMHGTSSSG